MIPMNEFRRLLKEGSDALRRACNPKLTQMQLHDPTWQALLYDLHTHVHSQPKVVLDEHVLAAWLHVRCYLAYRLEARSDDLALELRGVQLLLPAHREQVYLDVRDVPVLEVSSG